MFGLWVIIEGESVFTNFPVCWRVAAPVLPAERSCFSPKILGKIRKQGCFLVFFVDFFGFPKKNRGNFPSNS